MRSIEQVIQPNRAELVDHNDRVGQRAVIANEIVQQARLSGAQKAGENGDPDWRRRTPRETRVHLRNVIREMSFAKYHSGSVRFRLCLPRAFACAGFADRRDLRQSLQA